MKKSTVLFALIVAFATSIVAQPIINQNDMPNVKDTVRVSLTSSIGNIDYTSTGQNYTWDFSALNYSIQRLDSFVSVTSAPFIYYPYFIASSSIAQAQPDMDMLQNIKLTDVFNFYKETSGSFAVVGFGATFNSVPMPVKYDKPDVWYKFPLTIGTKDSCEFSYKLTLANMFYYGEKKKRVNFVDGWGTVITPFDTFQAVRVVSTSFIHDTINIDSLGIGFAQDRTEIEYKWLADNKGVPVFKVIKRLGIGGSVSIEYIDKYKGLFTNTKETVSKLTFVTIYPNPANQQANLCFSLNKSANIEIHIFDILGRNVNSFPMKEYSSGSHNISLRTNELQKGMYFVKISDGSSSKAMILQVI